ncbi:MAG: hypothetical protein U1F52_01935 [Burkholderiales bacterium]
MATLGLGLAMAGQVWHQTALREREADLLFVGDQYRLAISSYYRHSPTTPEFPRTLEDLLEDKRSPTVRRHLRRLYRDPMSGRAEWGLVRIGDRIAGVYSLHPGVPIRQSGFDAAYAAFSEAGTYADWKFVHTATEAAAVPSAAAPATSGTAPATALRPPSLPSSPVDAPASAPTPPLDTPERGRCEAQQFQDAAACQTARAAGADADRIRVCLQSMNARLSACRTGRELPPLLVQ